MKKDIEHLEDIHFLVDSFYTKVRKDSLLSPIFNSVIQEKWPEHLKKMYGFWQTVLLGEHTYYGNPFMPHADLPIKAKHFERWVQLFLQTLDENFEGDKTVEARWRATKMSEMFQYKIAHYRNSDLKPLI